MGNAFRVHEVSRNQKQTTRTKSPGTRPEEAKAIDPRSEAGGQRHEPVSLPALIGEGQVGGPSREVIKLKGVERLRRKAEPKQGRAYGNQGDPIFSPGRHRAVWPHGDRGRRQVPNP